MVSHWRRHEWPSRTHRVRRSTGRHVLAATRSLWMVAAKVFPMLRVLAVRIRGRDNLRATYDYTANDEDSRIENTQRNLLPIEVPAPLLVHVEPKDARDSNFIRSALIHFRTRSRHDLQLYHPLNSAATNARTYSNLGIASAIIQAKNHSAETITTHET